MTPSNRARKRYSQPHLWLINAIGVIVPRRLRSDWKQEWEAEFRHREALLADWDKLNWKAKLDLLCRSLLGQHFGINGPASLDEIEIIGVVKDSKYMSLNEAWRPMAYYPHSQRGDALNNFVVRFSGKPDTVIP